MFERFRRAFRDRVSAMPPEERGELVARMRDTLVQARVGLSDLRTALEATRRRLAAEQQELDTIRRRRDLAAGVGDLETVAVAERFEPQQAERVAVLERKLAAQESELALAERDVAEMTAELRAAKLGTGGPAGAPIGVEDELPDADAALGDEIERLARAREAAEQASEVERRLDALKRRMGK